MKYLGLVPKIETFECSIVAARLKNSYSSFFKSWRKFLMIFLIVGCWASEALATDVIMATSEDLSEFDQILEKQPRPKIGQINKSKKRNIRKKITDKNTASSLRGQFKQGQSKNEVRRELRRQERRALQDRSRLRGTQEDREQRRRRIQRRRRRRLPRSS